MHHSRKEATDAERDMATGNFTVLQPRQREYIKARADGKSRSEAKRIAQYAESTQPRHIENSSVKAAFARIVRRAAPADKLAKRIEEGLDATRTVIVGKGESSEAVEAVDFRERREYVKLAAEFGQYVEPEAKSQNQVPIEVNIKFIGAGRPALRPVSFALIDGVTGGKNTNG
jgi:hypothetical protein